MENLLIALKKAKKLEIFMSVVLLIAVTSIACNMDKVIETENESKTAQAKKTNGKVVVIDPGHGGCR